MIPRINAKVERALREAMTHVAKVEPDKVEHCLAVLSDKEQADALTLAATVVRYVVIDVCGAQWPTDRDLHQVAEDLATTGKVARQLQLDAGQIYDYLLRTVFGTEHLEEVIPDEAMFTRLPVIVGLAAMVVYGPKDLDSWGYLDQIESAIEVAFALDETVLPAAVMRAYMPKPQAGD